MQLGQRKVGNSRKSLRINVCCSPPKIHAPDLPVDKSTVVNVSRCCSANTTAIFRDNANAEAGTDKGHWYLRGIEKQLVIANELSPYLAVSIKKTGKSSLNCQNVALSAR
jgi:hypothetical protein